MERWSRPLAWVAAATMLLCANGCSKSSSELTVDLKTDFVPGVEFVHARTLVEQDGSPRANAHMPASIGDDFLSGHRIAELGGLHDGAGVVTVDLVDQDGLVIASRRTVADIAGTFALTVVISRSCRGVVCPSEGADPTATECRAGTCVPPECSPTDPASCGPPECSSAADCPAGAACARVACEEGVCLRGGDDSRCPAGQYCDPDVGCTALPGGTTDGGTVDAGRRDAGPSCVPSTEVCDGRDDDCNGLVDDACGPHQHCGTGGCVCDSGYHDCDGSASNGCESDLTTVDHCGSCSTRCSGSTPVCDSSTMPPRCSSSCTSSCVGRSCGPDTCNTRWCGTCPTGMSCDTASHSCVCPAGQANCGGTCRDTTADPANCGSCGHVCPSGQACSAGSCVCVPDCTGRSCGSNGCGGSCGSCPSGQTCSGGSCVCAPDCTGRSCGGDGCGGSCGSCPSGETCSSGACLCGTNPGCTGGTTCCGGLCADLSSALRNCGACGVVCGRFESCNSGQCCCGTNCQTGLAWCGSTDVCCTGSGTCASSVLSCP